MRNLIRTVFVFVGVCLIVLGLAGAPGKAFAGEPGDALANAFVHPPDAARPWVYWFWLNGNITREGITADLEAMARVGIGGVLIMEVDQGAPVGPADFMSDRWRELFHHVVAEAQRLGLEVNMNNDAGWNGSGGPWIKPEQSMQKVVFTEMDLEGPQRFEGVLAQPETVAGFYRDIALLAFPAPGSARIDNILVKAFYQTGGVGPAAETNLPPEMAVARGAVSDVSSRMAQDGRVVWDVPPGKWTLLRLGHTSTGVENAPSPASGRGLECDKLSKEGIEANFDGMMGKLIADAGPAAGGALIATHIDSWENGAQNWTARMRGEFLQRRGYDLLPFLPAMTGRVVESVEVSERFLWDLRQTVSDLVVENYAGHMQTLALAHGMRLSIEAYGGPCDDMPYAGRADEPMGEFWIGGSALSTCKEMASAAHTYGKRIVGAESCTAGDQERWLDHPGTLKALCERAFCAGINRLVFHRYALQPWPDRRPGMTMGPWGTHYERTQTWWELTPSWHSYLARCQFLLRQGLFVADVCYLQPEAAPQGFIDHVLNGYDFDNCSAETVLTQMTVQDGKICLPDGMSYRLLVLPDSPGMTPALLRKISGLVQAGANVLGPRPRKSPSLTGYPACDAEVKQAADQLWGACDGQSVKENRLGAGRVFCGMTPEQVLAQMGVPPDFSSRARLGRIHRSVDGTEIYFVANSQPVAVNAACTFRVSGKRPELWSPENGRIEYAAMFSEQNGCTSLPLALGPSGSVFVVFRDSSASFDPVAALTRDGKSLQTAAERAPKIVVERAVYGVLDDATRTRDVRDEVQRRADGGERDFKVRELASGNDPAPNALKTLVVEYSIEGRRLSVTGNDNDYVHLCEDLPAIAIEKAVYGVPGDAQRTRDVRAKLQHLVDTGEFIFGVARMAEGDDPAVMVVKTLNIEYVVDGVRKTAAGIDSDTIALAPPVAAAEKPAEIRGGASGVPLLEAQEPGRYELTRASGQTQAIEVAPLPPPAAITGPWEVRFPPNWGAPERVVLEELASLSEHGDPGVKYFSGTASYAKTFSIAAEMLGEGRRLYLDLGNVNAIAQITLNGKDLGTLYLAPFRADVTGVAQAGDNVLEVKVANLWVNRLIGDEQLPEDSDRNPNGTLKTWPEWLGEGKPSPTGRYTFTTWRLWAKDAPLPPSGLLGPVTLRAAQSVPVP